MLTFKSNELENKTANILWQYVSEKHENVYSGTNNVLIFNAKYNYFGVNKVTEFVLVLNGIRTRIDCKRISKGSNFAMAIANDLLAMNQTNEQNILFVLDGKGFENNDLIKAYKSDVANNKGFEDKNINFVMLKDLDYHIRNTFNVGPNWSKRYLYEEVCNL